MDQNRRDVLEEVQHWEEVFVGSEFDFPFSRFDIMSKVGAIILQLQRFGVVNIMGLDPNQAQVGDLAILVTYSSFYSRIQV